MKKLVIGAAAAAMTLTTFAASAASAHDWDRGRDGRAYYGGYASGGRYHARDGNRGYAYGNAWRYDRGRYDRDDDRGDKAGAAIMGGVVGLMLGAALADHNSQPTYGYNYGYSPYSYGYSRYGYGY